MGRHTGARPQEKRDAVVVTKLRRSERALLRQASRERRRAGLPDWTCSSILRQALLCWLGQEGEEDEGHEEECA